MIQRYRNIIGPVVLAATLLTTGAALAGDPGHPSGKVSIEEEQLGLILGGSKGTGTLTFEGREYPFELKGVSLGANVGVSKMKASGDVYGLKAVADFPGSYTKAAGEVAVGKEGIGGLRLENANGVIMDLRSHTEGAALNLGTLSAVEVTMEK